MSFERVINPDGEVGYFVPETSNAVIRTKNEIERAKQYASLNKTKKMHNGPKYVVSYNKNVERIVRDLSLIEAGALIKLILQLKINQDGKLTKSDKPLKKADIARLLGRSKSSTNSIIDRLMEIGILQTVNEYFRINPAYHTMGEMRDELFTKMYKSKTREIIQHLQLNEIGLLYKIIPFFHYSQYYLTMNPNAQEENIEYMGRVTLSKRIGHDVATVSKIMTKLQGAGAILITGSKNEVRYLVHPDLLFRQPDGTNTDWTWAVRKLFDDHTVKSRP